MSYSSQDDYQRRGGQNLTIECTIDGEYAVESGNARCQAVSCANSSVELLRGFSLVSTGTLEYQRKECRDAEAAIATGDTSVEPCDPYPLEMVRRRNRARASGLGAFPASVIHGVCACHCRFGIR